MLSHVRVACCHKGCGALVCFPPEVHARLRRTHEWWLCPFGHWQHFTGPTEEQRRIKALERMNEGLNHLCRTLRADAARCPWPACGRQLAHRDGLVRHLQRVHGMPTLAAVRAEEGDAA